MTPTLGTCLCFSDDSPSSTKDANSKSSDDSNPSSHIMFVRDVAPYQRIQYKQMNDYQDSVDICTKKKKCVTRVQALKNDNDSKYASIVPEIKVSSIQKNILMSCYGLNTFLK